jgi:hypothetical protein
MEIGGNDAKLRFWRNTDLSLGAVKMPYRTAVGVLGYEWDFYSEDCYQPEGAFTLSSSTKMVCIYIHMFMYVIILKYTFEFLCMCMYMYIYIYLRVYVQIFTYIQIYSYICTCIYRLKTV